MKKISILISAIIALVSCGSTEHIAYFQDTENKEGVYSVEAVPIRFKPQDKMSIIVNCKDPEVTGLFNLPYIYRYIGSNTMSTSAGNQGLAGYTVDQNGNIDFPIVGTMHVEGCTRGEAAELVKKTLTEKQLVRDANVTVEYMNLTVSLFGEINNPGRYSIDKDYITILDALAMGGDLTIYGRRDNIRVLRNIEGQQKTYLINLCSTKDLLNSPAYYIQQNDIIYVEPNLVRARQSTVNGNNVRSTSFWISLASLASTITMMIFNLAN